LLIWKNQANYMEQNIGLTNEQKEIVKKLTNVPEEYRDLLLSCKTSEEFSEKLEEIMRIGQNLLLESLIKFKSTRDEIHRKLALMGLTEKDLIDNLVEEEKYEAAGHFVKANDLIKRVEEILNKEN